MCVHGIGAHFSECKNIVEWFWLSYIFSWSCRLISFDDEEFQILNHIYDFSKKIFTEQHKKFVELVDVVTKLLMEIHKNYLATCILHDAESCNWADSKEFHEVRIPLW